MVNRAVGWLFSDDMAALLGEFGHHLPANPAGDAHPFDQLGDWADWLHHETLPGWLESLIAERADAGTDPVIAGLARVLTLEKIAAGEFNFRGDGVVYRERWAVTDDDDLPESMRSRVIALTDRLGLVTAQRPAHDAYDKTLILGGGRRSPLLRARLGAQLSAAGVELGQVALLGSPRFIGDEERRETDGYAPGVADEFELLVAAAEQEYGLRAGPPRFLCGSTPLDQVCPRWAARFPDADPETPAAFTHERAIDLVNGERYVRATALSASTGRPPLRPDTSDTLALWSRWAQPRAGQRALIITTQLFVPFQWFDALRRLYLPLGVEVDAAGFDAEWGDRPLTAVVLLQEVLSGIRSARRLVVDAAQILLDDHSAAPA
jgi:hypothetical protein